MKEIDYTGLEAAVTLLDKGMPIKDIARHPDAVRFFSYHLQMKKWLLKQMLDDVYVRITFLPVRKTLLQLLLERTIKRPVVVREFGSEEIECPYCRKPHAHGKDPGPREAECEDSDPKFPRRVGGRTFRAPDGYWIVNYRVVVKDRDPGKSGPLARVELHSGVAGVTVTAEANRYGNKKK